MSHCVYLTMLAGCWRNNSQAALCQSGRSSPEYRRADKTQFSLIIIQRAQSNMETPPESNRFIPWTSRALKLY